ncbi:MAG: HD domain-containing protein [Clostridia bacterium]|nr:HD domain-containing protein [Clostridia bacterium]
MEELDRVILQNRFLKIFDEKISDERDGKEALRDWLTGDECDFFTAPASTRYHGNYPGGLCEHSLDVYDMAVRLTETFSEEIRRRYLVLNRPYNRQDFMESLAVACLFHDLCKVNFYTMRTRNRNAAYVVDEQLPFGGHGSKSVYILSKYLKDLKDEEAIAINCHMGFSRSEDNSLSIGDSFYYSPLAWIVHTADSAATFLLDRSAEEE